MQGGARWWCHFDDSENCLQRVLRRATGVRAKCAVKIYRSLSRLRIPWSTADSLSGNEYLR